MSCNAWCLAILIAAVTNVRLATCVATLDEDVDRPSVASPASFGGLMTEEINHAYDGGLNAELIQNRTFQNDATVATR